MSNISSRNAAIALASTSARLEVKFPYKAGRSAGAALTLVGSKPFSGWTFDGQAGGRGSTPPTTPAVSPTRATAGALGQANPSGGRQKWLASADAFLSERGNARLFDRLSHMSGLSGTAAGAQSISSCAAPVGRYDDGIGNSIWLEIVTQIGATPTTVTATYTNTGGSSKTTQAVAIGGTNDREVLRAIELPLASGDTGVKSVQSITLAGTTGTAGNISVVLAHPIWEVGLGTARMNARSDMGADPGFIESKTDACWYWVFVMASTALSHFHAELGFLEA